VSEIDGPTAAAPPAGQPAVRVSTLELFFDLVFVFTLTQLTEVLVHHLDGVGVGQVVLLLLLIWWMYDGYAWLTNVVGPSSTTRRTLLLTGMAGFLVIALAIPDAFGESGWIFGLAYLVVNLVHAVLFARADDPGSARSIRRLAPLNLVSASLVVAGGFADGPFRYGLWIAAVLLQTATPFLHRLGEHTLSAGHFAERHALVIIIAIGESIVAIGLGFADVELDLSAVLVAVLGLCIAYYLWWAYFAGDEERARHALDAMTDRTRRAWTALVAWGYAHYVMILGIIVLSAGIKKTVGHPFDPLSWGAALALGGGVALFLLGHAWFLRMLAIPGQMHRVVAALCVLAAVPLGRVQAVALLAVTPLIMSTAMIIEDVPRLRSSGRTTIHTFGRTED
jgi:low temperature requirement protein LtrA